MAIRHPNYRRVKIHRNYTVEEISCLLFVHKNTVRAWVKTGLPASDDKRPILILGRELVAFLQARRLRNKRTCQPDELYCVRCHTPRVSAGNMADYLRITEKIGNLEAICPVCDSMMYRHVSMAKIAQIRGKLVITFPQALQRISTSTQPTGNSD